MPRKKISEPDQPRPAMNSRKRLLPKRLRHPSSRSDPSSAMRRTSAGCSATAIAPAASSSSARDSPSRRRSAPRPAARAMPMSKPVSPIDDASVSAPRRHRPSPAAPSTGAAWTGAGRRSAATTKRRRCRGSRGNARGRGRDLPVATREQPAVGLERVEQFGDARRTAAPRPARRRARDRSSACRSRPARHGHRRRRRGPARPSPRPG